MKSENSYYSFYQYGSLQPGRNFNAGDYRFGFNGQEMDNEVTGGVGNTNTAMFWEYDTRLGRRWNVDPVVKDNESAYLCFSGNPIWIVDFLGNDSALYNSVSGELISRGITPEDDKTAIWIVDPTAKNYNPEKPWATAQKLTYQVGKDSRAKRVWGTDLRSNHPLRNKGWTPGDQVYEEDLLDMTNEFMRVLTSYIPYFESESNGFDPNLIKFDPSGFAKSHQEASKEVHFSYLVGTDMPFDLKSRNRANLSLIPSYAAVIIGEYSLCGGRLLGYDDYGNISYGVWGRAYGYNLNKLKKSASIAQFMSTFHFDPNRDQYMITVGFTLWQALKK